MRSFLREIGRGFVRGVSRSLRDLSALCNISTYFDGTKNIDVPFVDDGEGNLVPATGNIGTPVIGVRDPATGIFTPDIAYPDAHLIEDKPCAYNLLLLSDDNIALQADNGDFLFGE